MNASMEPNSSTELAPGVRIASDRLRFTFSRSSGPGGQAVNKLNTRAELRVCVEDIEGLDERRRERLIMIAGRRLNAEGELVFHADTRRSQQQNRRACVDRLRALVQAAVHIPKKRIPTRPSRAMVERRLKAKQQRSETKRRRQRPDTE